MNKSVYEAPLTERYQVEIEGVFCASVFVENSTPGVIETSGHAVNNDLNDPNGWGDFNDQFSATGWE